MSETNSSTELLHIFTTPLEEYGELTKKVSSSYGANDAVGMLHLITDVRLAHEDVLAIDPATITGMKQTAVEAALHAKSQHLTDLIAGLGMGIASLLAGDNTLEVQTESEDHKPFDSPDVKQIIGLLQMETATKDDHLTRYRQSLQWKALPMDRETYRLLNRQCVQALAVLALELSEAAADSEQAAVGIHLLDIETNLVHTG